tara:strand:+ start:8648 stop:10120 length:1473 start_codon:yes stop_codon:yes gene_type:complete
MAPDISPNSSEGSPAHSPELEKAISELESALKAEPSDADSFEKLAGLLIGLGERDRTRALARNFVNNNASSIRALGRASGVFRRCGDHEDAAQLLRHAHYLDNRNVGIITALVHLNIGMGHVPEALSMIQLAVSAAPDNPIVHFGMGNVYYRVGRLEEALAAYHRAITLDPNNPQYRYMPSFVHLMRGEYREGWISHEERLDIPTQKFCLDNVKERLWFGEPLGANRILVHTEQGLGDTLQFVRYLPLLRKTIAPETKIVFLCPHALAPILRATGGFDEIHEIDSGNVIEYTAQIPLMSLPHRFGTLVETIPAAVPYIASPGGTKLRIDPPPQTRLKVGMLWGGNPQHPEDRTRSASAAHFSALFDVDRVHFYSLQYGDRAAEIDDYLHLPNVTKLSDRIGPFSEALAAVEQMDLIITVDTAMCHLAGAAGKPVWTLLQFGGEWRWFADREDSPWYPTMRLFRQPMMGDWRSVFRELRDALILEVCSPDR